MSDDFFDDEQELMAAQGGRKQAAPDAACEETQPSEVKTTADAAASPAPAREAPPFWMVLAIAAIALILGIVIGYLIGTSATLAELGSADVSAMTGQAADAQAADTQSAGDESASVMDQMPEGHPTISVDEDGTATVVDGADDAAADAGTDAGADVAADAASGSAEE